MRCRPTVISSCCRLTDRWPGCWRCVGRVGARWAGQTCGGRKASQSGRDETPAGAGEDARLVCDERRGQIRFNGDKELTDAQAKDERPRGCTAAANAGLAACSIKSPDLPPDPVAPPPIPALPGRRSQCRSSLSRRISRLDARAAS